MSGIERESEFGTGGLVCFCSDEMGQTMPRFEYGYDDRFRWFTRERFKTYRKAMFIAWPALSMGMNVIESRKREGMLARSCSF